MIPAALAKVAQDALLGALQCLLEAAADAASRAGALQQMDEVADTCLECAQVAVVISTLGRRAAPRRPRA